jgi:hypothetical protein
MCESSKVWVAESKGSLPEIAGVWSMVLDTFYLLLGVRASKFVPTMRFCVLSTTVVRAARTVTLTERRCDEQQKCKKQAKK